MNLIILILHMEPTKRIICTYQLDAEVINCKHIKSESTSLKGDGFNDQTSTEFPESTIKGILNKEIENISSDIAKDYTISYNLYITHKNDCLDKLITIIENQNIISSQINDLISKLIE